MHVSSKTRKEIKRKGAKALAVFLAFVLAAQSVNLPAVVAVANTAATDAMAQVTDTSATGTEATGEQPATPTDQTAPASDATAPAEEPATPVADEMPVDQAADQTASTGTDAVAGTDQAAPANPADNAAAGAPTDGSAPATPAADTTATVSLSLTQSTLTVGENTYTPDNKTFDTPANQELKFTVAPADGFAVSAVKQQTASGVETNLTANAAGEYTVAATDVADGLKLTVETAEVPAEPAEDPAEDPAAPAEDQPADDATTDETTDGATTGETTDEDSTAVEDDATLAEDLAANNGISLLSVSGSGTQDDPYQIEPGDTYPLSESYSPNGEWQIKGPNGSWESAGWWENSVSAGNATLSNIENGSVFNRTASATFELSEGDAAGTMYQVRYNSTIYYFQIADSTKATVSFNANGGWSAPKSITVDKGGTVTIPTEEPSRNGYTFAGWSTDSNATSAEYQPGQEVALSANMTLYAVWTQSATITFNPNGGTGDSFTLTTTEGRDGSFRLSLPNPEDHGITREGYTFVGWSTDWSGTGLNYTPQEITVSDGQTYYAIWAENDPQGVAEAEFFLRIDGDIPFEPDANIGAGGAGYFPGGCGTGLNGTIKQSVAINNNLQLVADNILQAPTDETIISAITMWNQTHSGNQRMSYDPATQEIVWYVIKKSGDHYHVDGVIQDKAVNRVTYDPNGGTSYVPTAKTYTEGTTVQVDFDTTPTRAGYTFLGWGTDKDATTPEYTKDGTNTFVMPSNDVTLYAIWQANNSTGYTVEHYAVNASGEAELYKEEEKSGKTDTIATATPIEIPGYTFDEDHEGTVLSGTITGDGKLVLKLYYTADPASIVFVENGGTEVKDMTGKTDEAIADTTMPATTRAGYDFDGWYTKDGTDGDWGDKVESLPAAFPAGVTTYYAKWAEDPGDKVDATYKVQYFKDGVEVGEPEAVETKAWAGDPTKAEFVKGSVNTTDKFGDGWSFQKTDPAQIGETVTADSTIKVYYTADPASIVFVENGGTEVKDMTGKTDEAIADTTMP
ncbi:InlB B-repeat-containing protein, partial [Collinsella sp. An268]|uniref:InlB B-repeat-containing protein n=1 Tax=Collinsella sp. An268 TaxID=1965612 RepID=UPI000B5709C2